MFILLAFAFLAGLATILAPCIWPLLPIFLSSAIGGRGHQRPLGITLGIMVSFAFFTLFISYLINLFHLDPNSLRVFAVIVLIILGLMMLIPRFASVMELFVSRLSTFLVSKAHPESSGGFWTSQNHPGLWSGFITGLSLGIVWSPCAGPILAAIATLSATGKVSFDLVLITIAYVIGVGIPLFLFAYGGQLVIQRTRILSQYTGRIQQIFGIIMILTALAIFTNYDKTIETNLLNAFPSLTQTVTNIDSNSTVSQQLSLLKNQKQQVTDSSSLLNTDYPAPEFTGITQWLNNPSGSGTDAKPLTMQELRGKVVLVDFWTYTCINCIRTLPFVTAWYDKYKADGFVVVGVHAPEFAFEHDTNNVIAAIKQFNIHYPVAQDNDLSTWNAYSNQYWPAEYLIDVSGNVRRTEFGEGNYPEMEQAIQLLLKDAGKHVTTSTLNMPDQTPTGNISPETYVGAERMAQYFPDGQLSPQTKDFGKVAQPDPDTFSLGGNWTIADQNAVSGKDAVLEYNFTAEKVFLVLAPAQITVNCPMVRAGEEKKSICGKSLLHVYLDGKVISNSQAGSDVKQGNITIDSDRLYDLVNLHGKTESHTLKLEFSTPGTQAFAFTFG